MASIPDSLAGGRFQLRRKLGAGGFGDVYEALDQARGSPVALKILRHVEPLGLVQFKREFRRVAKLVHPNLVRLYELIQDGDHWFFTMELVAGSHALDYVQSRAGASRDATLRRTFSQLGAALEALHAAGIVHRDIKPSNVMATHEGRVVLLDFGIAKEMVIAQGQVLSALIGTAAYLAPERIDHAVSHQASDWYSVGVMLYEALTGALPFSGNGVDVLMRKREVDAVFPTRVVNDAPPDLRELCLDLLNRDPEQRPTPADFQARLKADSGLAREATPPLSTPALERTVLVGRTAHLDSIHHAFQRVAEGRPAIVHVTGPSGIGKTSLVQRFLRDVLISHSSTAILTGACHQEESVAFNAIDELVDRLTDHLEQLPSSELALVLPMHSASIGRIFPVFRRVIDEAQSVGESSLVDPVEIRRQAFIALRVLLRRLCERSGVIIAIDDVQWGDRDSSSFLGELLRPPDAPALLLILSYRRHDIDGSVIDRLGSADQLINNFGRVDVEISELSSAEAATLARQLVEQQPAPVGEDEIGRIVADAGGNPFMIHRLTQHALTAPRRAGPIKGGAVIAEEIARFRPVHGRLMELIAVAGQPLPVGVAVTAATCNGADTIDLGALFAARLLQMYRRGTEDFLDIYHDRIRKHVLDGLTDDGRIALHQSLIEAFAAVRPYEFERLSYHCERSGRSVEASTHALVAAEQAGAALAFDKAVTLYRRALELGEWDEPTRHSILTALARTQTNAGRGLEAAKAFLAAAEGGNDIESLRLRIKAADQYLRAGYLSEGQALLKVLFVEVGLRSSERRWMIIASTVFNRARANALLKTIGRARGQAQDHQMTARMEVLWAAAVGLSMFDPISSAEFSARHLVLALASGNDYRIALGLAGEATQNAHRDGGRDGRPQELLQTARRYARRSGEAHALAFVHCMDATVAFLGGRWAESEAHSVRALHLLRERCTGVSWEVATATLFQGASHVFRGALAQQARILPGFVADARARGDVYAAEIMPALTMSWIRHLVFDDPDAALNALPALPSRRSLARWRVHDTNALAGQVQVAVYRGDPGRGWTLLEEYWPSLTRSPMFRVITIRTLMSMIRGGCALSLATSESTTASSRATLMQAAETAAKMMADTRCGWAEAFALALHAGIASCRGNAGEAKHLLQRAASDLHALELMPWHYAARWHRYSLENNETGTSSGPDSWWTTEQIARPQRIANLLVPGAWPQRAGHTERIQR